jgi:hypothetical protein
MSILCLIRRQVSIKTGMNIVNRDVMDHREIRRMNQSDSSPLQCPTNAQNQRREV